MDLMPLMSLFGSAAAGLLLALVLRSAKLINNWGHVVLIAVAWPIGIVAARFLSGFLYDITHAVAGFALGVAIFWALRRPT